MRPVILLSMFVFLFSFAVAMAQEEPPEEEGLSVSQVTIYDGSPDAEATVEIREDIVGIPGIGFIPTWLNPLRPFDKTPLAEPPDFSDACEALEGFSETDAYIKRACSLADFLLARVQDCAGRVQNRVAAIEKLLVDAGVTPTTPTTLNCPLAPWLPGSGSLDDISFGCSACPTVLRNLFYRVDALNRRDSACQRLRDDSFDLLLLVQAELAGPIDPSFSFLPCVFGILTSMSEQAADMLDRAVSAHDEIQLSKNSGACDFDTLFSQCESCGGLPTQSFLGPADFALNSLIITTGAVQEVDAKPLLEAVVNALKQSIANCDDPQFVERIGALIERLSSDKKGLKIRHTLIRSPAEDTNVYIAINPDSEAKLNVVMLTVLANDPDAPNPNLIDEQLLFEAFDLFAASLEPGSGGPLQEICDNGIDDDGDGLIDSDDPDCQFDPL